MSESIIKMSRIIIYIINFIIVFDLVFKKKEKPAKIIGWLMVLMFIPYLGFIFYILLGINWRKTVLNEHFSPDMADFINRSLKEYRGDFESLAKLVSNNNGSPMFLYNEVQLYKSGEEMWGDLINDINNAKHHVHLEFYIVKSDEIGKRIFDACKKASERGVKVRVVMDKLGGRFFSKKYKRELMAAGVEIVTYTATFAIVTKLIDLSLNYRNHRKIVVIDGLIGYIGGNNIGDEYNSKSDFGYWRDTHMRVKGDFVLGLQGLFFDDFFAVLDRNEHAKRWEYNKRKEVYKRENEFKDYFPNSEVTNYLPMQLMYSGPESAYYTIEQAYTKMIIGAKERIYLSTPYFIPSEATLAALKIAILSGVDVRIVFPEQTDHAMVGHASMSYIGEMLEYGARVFLYDKKSFTHNKALVIDGKVFSVGTANFDVRSFFFNYEVCALVYDEYLSSKMDGMFFEDMRDSKEITFKEYENRPFSQKIKEGFYRVFSLLF